MILFCLWWKASNQKEIDNYYKGIEEVFEIFNKYNVSDSPPLKIASSNESGSASASASAIDSASSSASAIATSSRNISFEELALIITDGFSLYPYAHTKHFCEQNEQNEKSTYPDCGETAARNIINILCFDGNKFDIEILKKNGAIKEVIDYYTIFNTFDLQSKREPREIFGMKLNARDAWSKMVIDKSQNNIVFVHTCPSPNYEYDMKGGLTKDRKKPNMLQLLNNLLKGIVEWTDLEKDGNITKIVTTEDIDVTGVGKVNITNVLDNQIMVDLQEGHYHTEIVKKIKLNDINYDHITDPINRNRLEVLLKKLTKEIFNGMWICLLHTLLYAFLF
jgi:hypothetical protein